MSFREKRLEDAKQVVIAAGYEIEDASILPDGTVRVIPRQPRPGRLVVLDEARKQLAGRHPAELGLTSIGKGSNARWDMKALEAAVLRKGPMRPEAPRRKRRATPKAGYVYFLQAEVTRFVKIGFSQNPKNRIHGIKTACPEELAVLYIHEGDENLELAIHRSFKEDHHRGEWFRPSRGLLEFIKDLGENEALALDNFEVRWVRGK